MIYKTTTTTKIEKYFNNDTSSNLLSAQEIKESEFQVWIVFSWFIERDDEIDKTNNKNEMVDSWNIWTLF